MTMQALHTAATGMGAQELNVQIISNNIANLRTTGFKRQRADFQDLLYQDLLEAGTATSSSGTQRPAGIQIGTGVRTVATPRIASQGTVESTDRTYDIAISGEGYFQITLPDGRLAYTRDGSFDIDGTTGQLVTKDGYTVGGGITIPSTAQTVTISSTGLVQATDAAGNNQSIGQLQLARFLNKGGLQATGNNLFLETPASGAAQLGNPGTDGAGTLLQKYIEDSNVNPVSEISDLIAAQRAYEMGARVMKATDEMLASTAQASQL